MKAEKQSITSSLSTSNFHKIAESNNSSQTISMKTTERGKDVVGSGMIVKSAAVIGTGSLDRTEEFQGNSSLSLLNHQI